MGGGEGAGQVDGLLQRLQSHSDEHRQRRRDFLTLRFSAKLLGNSAKVWGQHSSSEAAPLMLSVTPAAQVIAKLIQAPAAAAVAR